MPFKDKCVPWAWAAGLADVTHSHDRRCRKKQAVQTFLDAAARPFFRRF